MTIRRRLVLPALAAVVLAAATACTTDTGAAPTGDRPSSAWTAAPPIYQAAITSALGAQGCPSVDRNLLAAQLQFDSNFTHDAVSVAGLRGAAQIAPATWDLWAPKVGATDPMNILDSVTVQVALNCDIAAQLQKAGAEPTLDNLVSAYMVGVGSTLDPGPHHLFVPFEELGIDRIVAAATPQGS